MRLSGLVIIIDLIHVAMTCDFADFMTFYFSIEHVANSIALMQCVIIFGGLLTPAIFQAFLVEVGNHARNTIFKKPEI